MIVETKCPHVTTLGSALFNTTRLASIPATATATATAALAALMNPTMETFQAAANWLSSAPTAAHLPNEEKLEVI